MLEEEAREEIARIEDRIRDLQITYQDPEGRREFHPVIDLKIKEMEAVKERIKKDYL